MAFSRLRYDNKAYTEEVGQSTGSLGYLLNPIKYENCHKCRVNFGIVGGPEVSINESDIVDVESELSGRTRPLTKCEAKKFSPSCAAGNAAGKQCKSDSGLPYDCDECQPSKKHLNSCSIVDYPPRVSTVGYTIQAPSCADLPNPTAPPAAARGHPTQAVDVQPYRPSSWQGNTGLATW